jgi:hypothetical protein
MFDHCNHHNPHSFVEFGFHNEASEEVVPTGNSVAAVGNMMEVEPCGLST